MELTRKTKHNPAGTEKSMTFVPVASPIIGQRELEYVTDAVKSGWVSSIGPYVERFEQAFAAWVGVKHAVTVSNGTTGLHLTLHALGLGPGDEVILPSLTFAATAHAVLQTGSKPVFVDVDPDTWCIDPNAVEHAITSHTRAILPVHLYGHPANMTVLKSLAQEYGLLVIEDAAEAHGAEYYGRKVGSFGDAAVFSFYGNKIITTGEGGMITTDDHDLALRLHYLKDHGMSPARRYYHTELAFNYRMTNIQAALGMAQLEQIENFIERKRQIFHWYSERLAGLPGFHLNSEQPNTRNVFWLTCLVLPVDFPLSRDEFSNALRKDNIDSRPFFVPMHRLPHLRHFRKINHFAPEQNGCPVAERLSKQGLNLPSGCNLSKDIVDRVSCTILDVVRNQHISI